MEKTLTANPYDHPRFYDLAFGAEWRAEMKFLTASFRKYATIDVRRVFEPACGTGRLLFRLAQAGFAVSGLDLNERAVAFCNDRLRRKGFGAAAAMGDMTDFRLSGKVDAAFNLVSSFRHLESDEAAWSHLRCMAAAVRVGGIYVIGLHLTPTGRAPSNTELWTAERGHLRVRTRVLTTSRNLRRRDERLRVTFDVRTPTSKRKLENRIAAPHLYGGPILAAVVGSARVRNRRHPRLLLSDRYSDQARAADRRCRVRYAGAVP